MAAAPPECLSASDIWPRTRFGSKRQGTRQEAQSRLADIIDRLEKLLRENEIDPNQRNLLGRAYLIRGNLDYLKDVRSDAYDWYKKSFDLTPGAYSQLSMAQCKDNAAARAKGFGDGLVLLKRGPLRKTETYTKITALAWAVVATREMASSAEYQDFVQQLREANALAQPVGERTPLFFCPDTKLLVTFDTLKKNLKV